MPTATGRVWIRLAKGIDVRARAAEIADAGYEIDRVPGYAPNAAYVRAANAAASIDGLRAIPGVEHVEPETLRPRAYRK